jgi:hypothetical protein
MPRSSRPAGAADGARIPPESRISINAFGRWLLVNALGGLAIFLLVLLVWPADPGIGGFLGHLVGAFSLSFGFFILATMLLGIRAAKAAEPSWSIYIVLGGFGLFWLVLLLEHDLGLAFIFSLGFAGVEAMLVLILTMAGPAEPTRKDGVGPVGPVLEELEKVRLLAQRGAMPFRLLAAPIGACAGFALGLILEGVVNSGVYYRPIFVAPFAGGSGGFALGALPAAHAYARLYKARVLPLLVGVWSALRYQAPSQAQLQPLRALFQCDALKDDDAFVGSYRGLPVVVAQVRALRGAFRPKPVFAGLVVEVTLLNRLSGDTVIVPAPRKGQPHWARPQGLAPVGLEDPVFERAYDVYASDQVMARALLTPAFMERFRSLRGQALGLGHANQLFVAIPGWNVFTPPDFDKSARDPGEIARLQRDFAAVLGVIDWVIDLDSQTRAAAPPAPPLAPEPHSRRRS